MSQIHPVVSEARSWVGTRFHHQGRLKATGQHKGGVDCLGMVVEVARALGIKDKSGGALLTEYDRTDYAWLPNGDRLKAILREVLTEVHPGDIREGDIGLFRLDGNPQHMGIFANAATGFTLIHAYAPSRKVVEVTFDEFWKEHLEAVFRSSIAS